LKEVKRDKKVPDFKDLWIFQKNISKLVSPANIEPPLHSHSPPYFFQEALLLINISYFELKISVLKENKFPVHKINKDI